MILCIFLLMFSEGLIFSRMHNMQVLCPYYVKYHMKAMLH